MIMSNRPMARSQNPQLGILLAALFAAALTGAALGQSTEPPVVEVIAQGHEHGTEHEYSFAMPEGELEAGWTTFRLVNDAEETHFLVIAKLPGEMTDEEYHVAGRVFQEAMYLIDEGNAEDGFAKLGELPEWTAEMVYMGGPGFIAPDRTAETTVKLEPGTYAVECYVKTEDGEFHSYHGMFELFTVTGTDSQAAEPSADIQITLSNPQPDDGSNPSSGFQVEGDLTPGRHTVAVDFAAEEPPFLGNDVHLVRLGDDSDPAAVAAWTDWSQTSGLRAPAPAEFLGGTHEMPRGNRAYFKVDLEPGRYAWVSERPANMPMYMEFSVAGD